jgi:hypothetical protein
VDVDGAALLGNDASQDVPFGEDPDQALVLDHDYRADVPVVHEPGRVENGRLRRQ